MTNTKGLELSRADRCSRALGVATWVILASTLPGCVLLPSPWGGGADSYVGQAMLPIYFVLLLAQLIASIVAGRRAARLVLLAGLCLWGIGSLSYSAAAADNLVNIATPGAGYYIASYMLIAVYLLTDVPRKGTPSLAIWMDAVIVAGGAACVAGAFLLLPLRYDFGPGSAHMLVALLYPVLDVLFAVVVLAQVRMGARPKSSMTSALIAGFLMLTISDLILAQGVIDQQYHRYPAVDVICGIGLSLIVWAACCAHRDGMSWPTERRFDRMPTVVSLVASMIALVVVALSTSHSGVSYVLTPALLTLLAGQVRMGLAVREARGAAEARALSVTDDLTGLPNRRALTNRLATMLAEGSPLGLMLLDLDGFKEINDGLGHAAGDRLLRQAAQRVRTALPENVLVVRLGGDEFAMAVPTDDEDRLMAMAHVVLKVLRGAYEVDGVQLSVEGSIGVTVRCADDGDATDLLRRADVAMYQAKAARSGALLYDRTRDEFSRDRLELADALRRAITSEQIEMWYQPQVDARTGAVCGLEALVRWRHPTEGLVSPGIFLPLARRAGLMLPLSQEIVRQVVEDIQRWTNEKHGAADVPALPPVAVNVAPPELLGNALVPFLISELERHRLGAESVVLEVTEDSFLTEPARAREVLESLQAHGVLVSIDDYGTGYSSLAYLRDLPVHELKIDRSFVAAMDTDERSRMIVASTATMAHALSMRVVAEGVEDAGTARSLVEVGIDVLQGFHLARPMPFADVTPWRVAWHQAGRREAPHAASFANTSVHVPRQTGVAPTLSR